MTVKLERKKKTELILLNYLNFRHITFGIIMYNCNVQGTTVVTSA